MPAKKSTRTKIPSPAAKVAPVASLSKKASPAKSAPAATRKVVVPSTKAAPKKMAKTSEKPVAKVPVKVPAKASGSGVFVRFERYSPKSSRVDLVGSFNDWTLGKYPLVRDENGVWSIQIRLAPGTYEYKYVYDGHFYEPDPEQEQVANVFGSANNLLIVT